MQLTPEFLPVGSIVEYKKMRCKVIEVNDRGFVEFRRIKTDQRFVKNISELSGIPLTPKILTEWCGASELRGKHDEFGIVFENDGVLLEFGEMLNDGRAVFYYNLPDETAFKCIANIHYIHELQLLCAGLKLPLPIQIK